MKKLIDLVFLAKDLPFGIPEKNTKKSLYKIADPFMAFYYQFVCQTVPFRIGAHRPIEQALKAHFRNIKSRSQEDTGKYCFPHQLISMNK